MATRPPLYVFSLGPIDTDEGSGNVYLGYLDGQLLPAPAGAEVDEALGALRLAAPIGTALVCSPELARVGALHGFRSGVLPAEALFARAQLALLLAHVDTAPKALDLLPLVIGAAAEFWAAKPWEHIPADAAIALTLSGEVDATYEGAILGAGGEEFGVALYPKPGSIARLLEAVEAGRFEEAGKIPSLSVTLDEEPRFAAEAIGAESGMPRVPLLFEMRKGKVQAVERDGVIALAAALVAFARLGEAEDGFVEVVELATEHVGVDVKITARLLDVPPLAGKPASKNGTKARKVPRTRGA